MKNSVIIETSARHIHLCSKDVETLFGTGYKLTPKKELSQPGQYACEERVNIVGPKKEIKNVIILGPERPSTQVEVSLTDARTLGIDTPIRESGDIKGSAACKIVGPAGSVEISEGVIAAKRHIHIDPKSAKEMGVSDKQIVSVKINSAERKTILGDVVIRVNPNFVTAMHIDTDEANAIGVNPGMTGEVLEDCFADTAELKAGCC